MAHRTGEEEKKGTPVVTEAFGRFFHSQVNDSVVLMVCTIAALAWANSPFRLSLQHWVDNTHIPGMIGYFLLHRSLPLETG